jgi:hypothetical protein
MSISNNERNWTSDKISLSSEKKSDIFVGNQPVAMTVISVTRTSRDFMPLQYYIRYRRITVLKFYKYVPLYYETYPLQQQLQATAGQSDKRCKRREGSPCSYDELAVPKLGIHE